MILFLASDQRWYIGPLGEKNVRSEETEGTLIPLIDWQKSDDLRQWENLKFRKDPNSQYNPYFDFTLKITLNHGNKFYYLEVTEFNIFSYEVKNRGRSVISHSLTELIKVHQMRVYDDLLELDIEENEVSLR